MALAIASARRALESFTRSAMIVTSVRVGPRLLPDALHGPPNQRANDSKHRCHEPRHARPRQPIRFPQS